MKKLTVFLLSLFIVLMFSAVAIANTCQHCAPADRWYEHNGVVQYFKAGADWGNNGWKSTTAPVTPGGDTTINKNKTITNSFNKTNTDINSHNKITDVDVNVKDNALALGNGNVAVSGNGNTVNNMKGKNTVISGDQTNIKAKVDVDVKTVIKDNKVDIDNSKNYIKGDLVKGDKVAGDKNLIKGDYYGDGSLRNEGVIDQSVNVPRDFPQPATPVYPGFTNDPGDTQFANIQTVKSILMFGCEYNKTHLENMRSDGYIKTLQFSNIYGNTVEPTEDNKIIIIDDPKMIAGKNLKKIGTVVKKGRTGNTTTEQVLADVAIDALTIKGAQYVFVSGEGLQKSTSALGVGVSLGYTYASVGGGKEQDHGNVGAAGIGVAWGNTGRQAEAFIQGIVLTDEKTFAELMKKPEQK